MNVHSHSIIRFRVIVFFLVAIVFTQSGCDPSIGEKLADGAGKGFTPHAEDIGANLVKGAKRGYDESDLDAEIYQLVDSLSTVLGLTADSILAGIPDRLAGPEMRANLDSIRQVLIGDSTRAELRLLTEEVVNEDIRRYLKKTTLELLRDIVRPQLTDLRDELVGEDAKESLAALIDTAMFSLAQSYKDHLQGIVHEDLDKVKSDLNESASFIEKQAVNIIKYGAIALILVFSIIGFFFYRIWKKKKAVESELGTEKTTVGILTTEIEEMSDEQAVQDLKKRIQRQARQRKVEPHLQEVLKQHGITAAG